MNANYSLSVFWSEEDESFVALSPEFPGISAFGETYAEAVSEIESVLASSIDLCNAEGENLPEPRLLPQHSGQFRIRLPKYLHTSLVLEAERQGVSLNTLVQTYLAQSIAESAAEDCFAQFRKRLSGLCANMISSWYRATVTDSKAEIEIPQAEVKEMSWLSVIDTSAHHVGEIKCLS